MNCVTLSWLASVCSINLSVPGHLNAFFSPFLDLHSPRLSLIGSIASVYLQYKFASVFSSILTGFLIYAEMFMFMFKDVFFIKKRDGREKVRQP